MFKNLIDQLCWKTLTLVCIYILLFTLAQWLIELNHTWLEYQKNAIEQGQVWRLISGHFVHSNTNHLLMNSLGFLALWSLHGQYYQTKSLISITFTSALLVSISLYLFSDIHTYVGFSAVLHSLIAWGALKDIQQHEKTGYLLLIGVITKVIWEQIFGASQSTVELIGVAVATKAHLSGVIIGIMYFFITQLTQTKKQ